MQQPLHGLVEEVEEEEDNDQEDDDQEEEEQGEEEDEEDDLYHLSPLDLSVLLYHDHLP